MSMTKCESVNQSNCCHFTGIKIYICNFRCVNFCLKNLMLGYVFSNSDTLRHKKINKNCKNKLRDLHKNVV